MDLLPQGAKTADGDIGPQAVGYIKNGDTSITCRNDYTDSTTPRASYGALTKQNSAAFAQATSDPSDYVWNYWGYNDEGYAYPVATSVADGLTRKGDAAWDPEENPVSFSLSNRYADPSTIITHCVYHRPQTADGLPKPNDLYHDSATVSSKNARDIVLRLDGSARALNVTTWKNSNVLADLWQNQIVPN